MSKTEMSKLALVAFKMMLISGVGVIIVQSCLWFFCEDIEITSQILLAYVSIFIFWPFVVISCLLGLISIFRIKIKKQKGIKYAYLTIIIGFLLIVWSILTEISPRESDSYDPPVSETENGF